LENIFLIFKATRYSLFAKIMPYDFVAARLITLLQIITI